MSDSDAALPPPPDESALKRDAPLIPADSIAGRALVVVVAILTFLACLTAGGAILMADASRGWRASVSRDVTVQIKTRPGEDADALVEKAAEIARKSAGVTDVRIYGRAESEKLLEPWLGTGLDLSQLPLPRLVVAKMPDESPEMVAALKASLAQAVPQASLDDHRLWLSRLSAMADAVVAFAVALFLLVITAMATAVGFATRGAMAGNREIVEVLHFVGAADDFISREFQRHFLRLGIRGALLGGAGAAAFFLVARLAAAWSTSSAGAYEIAALFGAFALGIWGYGAIFVVCVGIGLLTGFLSRAIVFRELRRLE